MYQAWSQCVHIMLNFKLSLELLLHPLYIFFTKNYWFSTETQAGVTSLL